MNIPIKRLHPTAQLPRRANPGDAGLDLYALEGGAIEPGDRGLVKTGISIAVPAGYFARICPRSGLAVKKGIDVLAGVVDHGYSGDVGVALINHGHETFYWDAGDRIAQLIIERTYEVEWTEVEELPASERAAGGFGSTGA